MGIKFSRKRDASVNGAEAAEEPTVAQPEEPEMQPGTTLEHDPDDKQDLDVVVMTPASPVASLPKEDCVWESKEVKEEDEAELKGIPAPADPSVPDPDPATGALVCSTLTPAGPPVDPEPASEALGHKDTLTIETIIEPIMSSPTMDELGDPAPAPGPGPGPEPTPASVNLDDDFHDKCEETTESAGELVEAELAGSSQKVGNDVDEGGVEKLLENLELTESDLTVDIIPADDTPDMHT